MLALLLILRLLSRPLAPFTLLSAYTVTPLRPRMPLPLRRRRVLPSWPRIRESLGLLRSSRVMLTILARLSYITLRAL
jgi:hypothetical protein